MDLAVFSFVSHSSLLTVQNDGSHLRNRNYRIFHSRYVDYSGAFRIDRDLYCCNGDTIDDGTKMDTLNWNSWVHQPMNTVICKKLIKNSVEIFN